MQSAADGRYQRPRLAYRDVAGATNQLTLIAAMLPAGCVSTHTVFCLRTPCPLPAQQLLCGLFNSFVVNYLVRLRVSTHVTTALVERLPVPTREHAPRAAREIAALARALSRRRDPPPPRVCRRASRRCISSRSRSSSTCSRRFRWCRKRNATRRWRFRRASNCNQQDLTR